MSRLLTNANLGERRRGCVFAEDFVSTARIIENNGQITGSPTIANGMAEFDGTNKAIDYKTNNPFANGQPANFTFIFKVVGNDVETSTTKPIIALSTADITPCITFLSSSIRIYFGTGTYRTVSGIENGKEYHIAITSNGTVAGTNIYVNGMLASATSSGSTYVPFNTLYLGQSITSANRFFSGKVGGLKIFNKQLTPLEIYQDFKGDTEFDDVVYTDNCTTDKWASTANITKEFLPSFEGETGVMKITATSATGITIAPNPAIATEVGILYKATLRVWVPTTNGGVAWFWNSDAGAFPRQTTVLREQWVDLDIFFIGTATTQTFYLNPVSNGNSCYISSLIVSKYNTQVCDVDLRFRPEDNSGARIINHADPTNPFIPDSGVSMPQQLKYGGIKGTGNRGLISTKAIDYKYHGVENYVIAFTCKAMTTNNWVFTTRNDSTGGIGVIYNAGGTYIFYIGGTVITSVPYTPICVMVFQRVMNIIYCYLNGRFIGSYTFTGSSLLEGNKLYLLKRGGSTACLEGSVHRLKHTYGFMTEKQVQKCTFDFLRSIKGGEVL
jgi:hypothetical protein